MQKLCSLVSSVNGRERAAGGGARSPTVLGEALGGGSPDQKRLPAC
jgi:hypothetical protein